MARGSEWAADDMIQSYRRGCRDEFCTPLNQYTFVWRFRKQQHLMKRALAELSATPLSEAEQRHVFVTSALFPGDVPTPLAEGGGAAGAAGAAMLRTRATATNLAALADWFDDGPIVGSYDDSDDDDSEKKTQAQRKGGLQCSAVDLTHVDRLSPRDQERLSTYLLMRAGQWLLEPCRLYNNFTSLEPLHDGKGVSDTFMFFATLSVPSKLENRTTQPNVMLKMAFASKDPIADDSLRVERDMYELVANTLFVKQYTPHVVLYYGELACIDFYTNLRRITAVGRSKRAAFFYELVRPLRDSREYNVDDMHTLITESVPGRRTWHRILERTNVPDLDDAEQLTRFTDMYCPVLFQLLYTLQVFAEVGLQHNDLHANNILIALTPTDYVSMYYELDADTRFVYNTDVEVRIIDFDRAIKVPTRYDACRIDNTVLTSTYLCERYGQCPQFDARVDLFTVLRQFYYYTSHNRYAQAFVERQLPKDLLDRPSSGKIVGRFAYLGSLCVCGTEKCKQCTLLRDERIPSARTVLMDEAFREHRWSPDRGENWPATEYWRLPSSNSG